MNAPQRIHFDVSYTRTQMGNVGITRTVRRLADALNSLGGADACVCRPVTFHTDGFRLAAADGALEGTGNRASTSRSAQLLRWATNGFVRRAVSALVPMGLLHRSWRLYNRLAFDRLSRSEKAVEFQAGDWLVLADQSWNYRAWTAAASARQSGAKVVLIVYDLIPLTQPQYCNPLFTRVFGEWLQRMLGVADAVLCISKATEQDLHAYGRSKNLGLPATACFRLGGDKLEVRGEREVRPPLAALFSGHPCFAAIGSFEPRKNYGFLLDVFEELWAEGHGFRLVVIGRQNEESRVLIDRFRRHREIGNRLMCVFDASDAEIAFAYARCQALLFPSLAEGFGLPLVEARMLGCRVIASDLPALAELADKGVSLFPVNSRPALKQLVLAASNPSPGSEPGKMPHFGWEESALQMVSRTRSALQRFNHA
jgi:glycosyltransferase involved in cell wall biosynthesis